MNYTDLQLVEKYFECKAKIAELQEAVDTFKDGMTLIENIFLGRLNERGADNTKTDAGTAYKSTIVNFKVVDQKAFLDFCVHGGAEEMMKISAIKDEIKTFMNGTKYQGDTHGLPPGLEMTEYTNVNIRRT